MRITNKLQIFSCIFGQKKSNAWLELKSSFKVKIDTTFSFSVHIRVDKTCMNKLLFGVFRRKFKSDKFLCTAHAEEPNKGIVPSYLSFTLRFRDF